MGGRVWPQTAEGSQRQRGADVAQGAFYPGKSDRGDESVSLLFYGRNRKDTPMGKSVLEHHPGRRTDWKAVDITEIMAIQAAL